MENNLSLEQIEALVADNAGVLLYFSGETCSICHALRPKVKELFDSKFPQIKQIYVDASQHRQIAMNYNVMTVPTLMVFLDGKEFVKESRTISLDQISTQLSRPYQMMFG